MRSMLKLAAALTLVVATATAPAARGTAPFVGPTFQSIGTLAFGPQGVLYAADPLAATIFAVDLGAQAAGAVQGTKDVPGIDQKIAALLGTDAASVTISDLAVHPTSHNSFIAVTRGQGAAAQPALVRVDGAGTLAVVATESLRFTSVSIPNPPAAATTGRNNRTQSITDMAYSNGRLYVAGLSNEEFSSKFWSVPYPFQNADNGASVEIFHGNHGRLETNSPVMAFVPTTINNQPHLIAGYTCTPLVKFPIGDLRPGAKILGTTIAELGAGNRPIDMVLYKKGGTEFLLMTNTSRGVMKIATTPFATAPGITAKVPDGTAGVPFENITTMQGVVQMDLLDAGRSIVITRTGTGAAAVVNLAAVALP
jgi:hypothetical protein